MTKRERKKATGISLYPSEMEQIKQLSEQWGMSINDTVGQIASIVFAQVQALGDPVPADPDDPSVIKP